MAHSIYIVVPISGQGIVVDPGMKTILERAMASPFDYTDVFMYSHGWWTRAEAAMIDYNRFLMGFAPVVIAADTAAGLGPRASLGIGLHWPSMVSEDANTPLTVLQPFTFFNRSKMADEVGEHGGYSLLRIMLEARKAAGVAPPRFHLTGHSFGCKVVCSTLEELAVAGLLSDVTIHAVLLQAAFDDNALEPGQAYGHLFSSIPKLRILATKSDLDTAVGIEYTIAEKAMNFFGDARHGLGSAGPSAGTVAAAGGVKTVQVGPNYQPGPAGSLGGKLVVADLTPLHQANPAGNQPFSGHHSDIFHDEIYRLMAAFFFS